MRTLLLSLVFLTASLPSIAHAADPVAGAPAPVAPERTWYGWQTLLVDGAAAGLMLASVPYQGSEINTPLLGVGLGGYALGAPVTHLFHGHGGRAAGSLGLRLGMPAVGFLLGAAIGMGTVHDSPSSYGVGPIYGAIVGGTIGGGVGAIGAIALDASLLGFDDAPPRPRDSTPTATFAPSIAITPHGGSAGLVGVF